jgi:Methyltransferase domain
MSCRTALHSTAASISRHSVTPLSRRTRECLTAVPDSPPERPYISRFVSSICPWTFCVTLQCPVQCEVVHLSFTSRSPILRTTTGTLQASVSSPASPQREEPFLTRSPDPDTSPVDTETGGCDSANIASRGTSVAVVADSTSDDSVLNAYDTVAADYSELLRTALTAKPFDRAMLVAFAELINTGSLGRVADLGCRPGHVTAFLHGQGLNVFGMDLSSQMIAMAKRAYPELGFDVGSMRALALENGTLGGITSWYSIIHTPAHRTGIRALCFS